MHRVFASTGAFIGRPNGRDFRLIGELAPKVRCDGFELMFYEDWYGLEKEISDFLTTLGIGFPTFHCEKKIGELLAQEKFDEALEKFEANCLVAQSIGSKILILHLWNGIISDTNIEANFSAYPKLAHVAERYGLVLTAENVIAHSSSPLALCKRLLEAYPDACLTYDTKMAQFDLENEKAFSEENLHIWQNVRHMHLNDRAGGYRDWSSIRALNIGEGEVDFNGVFSGLKKVGYLGDFTVEANSFTTDGVPDLEALSRSVEKVKMLIEKHL